MALSTRVEAIPATRAVTPLHVPHRPTASVLHAAPAAPDVKLLVAVSRVHKPTTSVQQDYHFETLQVMPDESIKDIKLRLHNRGWFSSRQCLVFGDKELADHIRISDMVANGGKDHPSYLHVFVKLSDVESVSVRTLLREVTLNHAAVPELESSTDMTTHLNLQNLPQPESR